MEFLRAEYYQRRAVLSLRVSVLLPGKVVIVCMITLMAAAWQSQKLAAATDKCPPTHMNMPWRVPRTHPKMYHLTRMIMNNPASAGLGLDSGDWENFSSAGESPSRKIRLFDSI